jgi:predicted cupin superfamily sugar epimerase
MNAVAERWIRALELSPHPEGGFFRETWRASEVAGAAALPGRFAGPRAFGTAILYLLPAGARSRLHRLRADEVWHFHDGGPLHLHLLTPGKGHERIVLGRELERGERVQAVVPHGTWFGAEAPGEPALAGCTLAPGFDYSDFELGSRAALLAEFPREREWIERLTDAEG